MVVHPDFRVSRRGQPGRHITTARRARYEGVPGLFLKYSLTILGLCFTGSWLVYGIAQTLIEWQKPTPEEWSFWTRTKSRSAFGQQKAEVNPKGLVDWALVGSLYRQVLARLEDPKIDGKGLVEAVDGGVVIPDAGKAGYDVSSKSEAWRYGYFDTLMGCAKAAEHLDDMVVDVTTNRVSKAHYVIGPSNPDPKPLPPWQPYAPLEENCKPASPPPEQYYVRILTTTGFTSRQRLDAAIAYADWLDYKSLSGTAEEVLNWAVDIATSQISNVDSVIDPSTHVLVQGAANASKNLLTATTALATHYAQNGRVSEALPIFVSALRALRAAPRQKWTFTTQSESPPATDYEAIWQWTKHIAKFFQDPPYPFPDSTGNEPLERRLGDATACEEAKLEIYIGEILFAMSSSPTTRTDAVAWTKDAVDKATLTAEDPTEAIDIRLRCLACAEIGLSNWGAMAKSMQDQDRSSAQPGSAGLVPRSWKRRFGLVTAPASSEEPVIDERWVLEEREAEKRLARFQRRALRESMTASPLPGFWSKVGWLLRF